MQHGGDKIGDVYLSKKQKRLGIIYELDHLDSIGTKLFLYKG